MSVITAITKLKVPCTDASTGFRAIRKNIADRMKIHGSCLCGTFILEAARRGARVESVPISVKPRTDGNRKIRKAPEADHMGTLRIDPMHTQRYLKWGRKNEGGRTHT